MLPKILCDFGAGCSLSLKLVTQHGHWVQINTYERTTSYGGRRVRVKFSGKPTESFTYCPSNQTWHSRVQKRVTVCVGMLVDKLCRCNWKCAAYLLGTKGD